MLIDLREAAATLINKPVVRPDTLLEKKIPRELADALSNRIFSGKLHVDSCTAFTITSDETSSQAANYAVLPNQFFRFAIEVYKFALELKKYAVLLDRIREDNSAIFSGDWAVIKNNILGNVIVRGFFENEAEIEIFSKVFDETNTEFRLGAKSIISGNKPLRSTGDFFSSVILTQTNLPNASSSIFGALVYSLSNQVDLYEKLITFFTANTVDKATTNEITLLSKSFILLAGISGTGKTRFVREQASNGSSHCKIIPVRPDWHEPSDLLGYVSRIGTKPKYIPTETLKFLADAWKDACASATEDAIVLNSADEMKTFWLCLDEMNLAPVEQYFADYLSVLETRKWDGGDNYCCDPILRLSDKDLLDDLRGELGFSDAQYDQLWSYFSRHGIPLPPNLIVAGTVNMDETTHGFSRKVIDRALTFDFGEFFPNDFDQFFSGGNPARQLGFPRFTQATPEILAGVKVDPDGALSIGFLKSVNDILKGTPFELAYRALNELLLSVACQNPVDEAGLLATWDDFVMMKVLPRIEGDNEKLAGVNSDGGNVIQRLIDLLNGEFKDIESERPDFYRQTTVPIPARSIKKLQWMKNRLLNNGFTSFWP